MIVTLEIPQEAIDAMQLPQHEVEREMRKELAVALYGRGALSMGKAVEVAGVTRREFEQVLAERQAERSYDLSDLQQDLAWAQSR